MKERYTARSGELSRRGGPSGLVAQRRGPRLDDHISHSVTMDSSRKKRTGCMDTEASK